MKTLIIGALALLTTFSFAAEKLGTQNFAPEALEKIKSFKTISPMSLDKATELDAGYLSGVAFGSGENGGFILAISDLFWASTCSNEFNNVMDWSDKYKSTKEHRNKMIILARLKEQAKNNVDAKLAYRAIIVAERIANCGSEDDIYGNFIELIK